MGSGVQGNDLGHFAAVVPEVRVGARFEQQMHDLGVAVAGSVHERGLAFEVLQVQANLASARTKGK